MSSSGANDGEKMVRLRASDGEEIEVEESVAVLSQTVKFAVEAGMGGEDSVIPIPKVDGKTLAKILEYCKEHTIAGKTEAEKEDFDKKFVEVNQAELYDLLAAATSLEISDLVEILVDGVVDMIKGKTLKELTKMFKIREA